MPAAEKLNFSAIRDARLGVEAADLGVFESDVFIQADAVGASAFTSNSQS